MKAMHKQYAPPQHILKNIHVKQEQFWNQERETRALDLFHRAANQVPAYKDFLSKHGINPKKIKNWQDFQLVPPTSKADYLRQYPIEKLHWNGSIAKPMVLTATSGSTGEPFYFSRNNDLDWQYSILLELYLQNSSYGKKPTLVLICFGMGVWIGGLITYKAFELAGQRGYPISILTPGINKGEIFKALKKIAPNFAQTILVGYPPFIKDIIDESAEEGVDLHRLRIRLLFAAESFTEHFRDYLIQKTGIKNLYLDTLNIYGSADIGAMAFETPIAILARRIAMQDQSLFLALFSQSIKTPTLAQYNPLFITFETTSEKDILLTGNNTLPLIRYAIGDHGGTMLFHEVESIFKKAGVDLLKEGANILGKDNIYKLPFVYVYERKDLSTTLYGLQIYPETIRAALLENPISKFVTGKFTMLTKYSKGQNQYLEINIELCKDYKITSKEKNLVLKKILSHLLEKNSEFRELHQHLGSRSIPKLVFWPKEHPMYFKMGTKQMWVMKTNHK
ncbi:MAG: phenylacetate--CoA ligase family protein [Candidatus Wildermuthbacteria bacterium]|nr:phenylacetate--CoA ligase family protein [Candidatus Wildermuthbacteria bacterium]